MSEPNLPGIEAWLRLHFTEERLLEIANGVVSILQKPATADISITHHDKTRTFPKVQSLTVGGIGTTADGLVVSNGIIDKNHVALNLLSDAADGWELVNNGSKDVYLVDSTGARLKLPKDGRRNTGRDLFEFEIFNANNRFRVEAHRKAAQPEVVRQSAVTPDAWPSADSEEAVFEALGGLARLAVPKGFWHRYARSGELPTELLRRVAAILGGTLLPGQQASKERRPPGFEPHRRFRLSLKLSEGSPSGEEPLEFGLAVTGPLLEKLWRLAGRPPLPGSTTRLHVSVGEQTLTVEQIANWQPRAVLVLQAQSARLVNCANQDSWQLIPDAQGYKIGPKLPPRNQSEVLVQAGWERDVPYDELGQYAPEKRLPARPSEIAEQVRIWMQGRPVGTGKLVPTPGAGRGVQALNWDV